MPSKPTRRAVRAFRLLRLLLHVLRAVLVAALIYPLVDRASRRRRLKAWSAGLLRLLAGALRVDGVFFISRNRPSAHARNQAQNMPHRSHSGGG